ncbi:MAG: diphthine synthase [Nitrososphaera sp.]
MLWFVGAGIGGYRGISIEAVDILKECDVVYVERFTSALHDADIQGLNSLIQSQVMPVQRWFVEDGREILEAAKASRVALVTYGDPLMATTHNELRVRAAKNSIKTSVHHSASGIYSTIGEMGLHVYKFGRMVTIMSEPQSAISVYNTIFENLLAGSHTLVLTEYRYDGAGEPFFLDPRSVFKMLLDVEADQKHQVFSLETFAIVASRVGQSDQKIVSAKIKSLAQLDFGTGPHSIAITGSMHFTETESISTLTQNLDSPSNNSRGITQVAAQMVERYAPKAKLAAQQMREFLRKEEATVGKGMFEVLDNAEYYISDAERFLNQGKPELAVLSIGYAEGLVDALRFQKGVNPWLPPS